MDPRRTVSPESALASDIFDKFCSANTLKSILAHYRQLCSVLRVKPTHFPDFYPRLKSKLSSWRAQGLWAKFEKRASHKCYGRGKACVSNRVLIIGSGPCGLRAAIEAQLLGAKVVLIEKRDRFSRNNVLHLWPFVITDLKGLGAKKFYGKFCAGSIDHISIRQLQCILLKVALLLGVEVHEGVSFEGLRSPADDNSQSGWRCFTSPPDHPVSHYTFDVLIGADGRRNTLDGFRRKALRAKLAIAITANFINKHTEAEARVKEISGVSYIFNQKFFQELNDATGIDLENIVYYKDETHYFVMTAKKQSLLQKGVLLQDYADTAKLLSHENISTENLMIYALEAAIFSTENQLPNLEFAVNHYGQPDVAMFDFTAMYQAENACRVVERNKQRLLMTLVGDSLLEPFWPTGSGCARGFLSSFDACWMLRSWALGTKGPLEVMAERESIYRLLAQTTPENLNKEHTSYTIDPHSRYPNLNLRAVMPFQVKSLLDTDSPLTDVEVLEGENGGSSSSMEGTVKKRRRDSVIAVDYLLSWLRDQCQCYGLEVNDVRDALSEGQVLCALIHRFRPDLIEEYPLPTEENVDPVNAAAYRNELAFDILCEEYGLPQVMSGWESVQGTPDFLGCVAYLSQVYEIFRGEIPQVRWQRGESCEDLEEAVQQHKLTQQQSSQPHQFRFVYKGKGQGGRRSRVSSSGRESRAEGDSEGVSQGRRHKKRRSEDRSARRDQAQAAATSGVGASSSGGNSVSSAFWNFLGRFNPLGQTQPQQQEEKKKVTVKKLVDPEEREKTRQDIERNRQERMRRRKQDRQVQTERFIKSMRLLHLNDRGALHQLKEDDREERRRIRRGSVVRVGGSGDEENEENVEGEMESEEEGEEDENFGDFTFHLYRQTAPGFQERLQTIEQKLAGREIRTTLGGHRRAGSRGGSSADGEEEKNVTGLARNLEAKLKGRGGDPIGPQQQKPKDLIRAIGKIEKTDWNVQLIEKKIAESKGPSVQKAERDDKVPKWSREAFDDKREALKRKMEGMAQQQAAGAEGEEKDKLQLFEETMKKLGCKLREGNALEVGQRGSNKVSAMAEQLVHKLEKAPPPKVEHHLNQHQQHQTSVNQQRPVFEFPKKGGSECCHFCKERVYVVERMTAEGKYFHRNCFRCEYCNTALRVGNYVFDREGRYGDRFFCTSHYNTIWLYGWKKYDQVGGGAEVGGAAAAGAGVAGSVPPGISAVDAGQRPKGHLATPTTQQILSEMDERGTTPERVEFENSVECASEDDLLSEMDEDEWTDRNFGASNADNLTPDEASDLSDDDITPEGINLKVDENGIPERPQVVVVEPPGVGEEEGGESTAKEKVVKVDDSSDSDTEVASGDDEEEDDDVESLEDELEDEEELDDEEDEDDEDEEEEEEEEGGGSTTEIETDSEFAEDPPHSVPGTIPTIVVDEPEQIVTRMLDMPMSHTQTPTLKRNSQNNRHQQQHKPIPPPPPEVVYHIEDLNQRMVEPVKKVSVPERPLPRVTAVPRKWEPLNVNPEGLATKMSLELKKKYMMGGSGLAQPQKNQGAGGGAAQSQFRSVLDMISEQQKRLQPAAKPSATMQAFLDGAEKLKQKPTISPLGSGPPRQQQQVHVPEVSMVSVEHQEGLKPEGGADDGDVTPTPPSPNVVGEGNHPWAKGNCVVVVNGDLDNTLSMNRLNLEKSAKISPQQGEKEDVGREKEEEPPPPVVNGGGDHHHPPVVMVLSGEGLSQSETETQSTIIAVGNKNGGGAVVLEGEEEEQKTPVAEKPFEHNLEPGKDRVPLPLGDQGQEETDTETGDDPLSDEELEEDDFDEEEPRVKREPPRVEIEDEFGGVTLAVDVDQEIDESVRISGSDSRDSLNSGVFLETSEMSDWGQEGDPLGEEEELEGAVKDNNNKQQQRRHRGKRTQSGGKGAASGAKPPLCLELEDMDFMDVDALSSPEEAKLLRGRVAGYSKLQGEEDDDEGESTEGPESILPDFSVVLRATQPHDTQPSPNTLERQQRPTYSSDEREDESARSSSTPTVEESLGGKKKKGEAKGVPDLEEAVNPVMVENMAQNQAALELEGKELPRKGPFSNARDSLDYRKMKGPAGQPVKSKELYSTWMKGGGSGSCELLQEENSSASSASTSTNSGGKIASPEMARKIEEIHKERAKQNDLIRSMVMGRIRKSPEKNSRRGSRGSLSPLGGGSSSGSGSGSSEHVLRATGGVVAGEEGDSRRSSQNSILSRETEEEYAEEGEVPSTTTTSATSSGSIPHQPLGKSNSSQTTPSSQASQSSAPPATAGAPGVNYQPQYSPVFTSSPRFRNRPKFDSPLSVYQSATNPPTPVNPLAASQLTTPSSEGGQQELAPKSIKVFKSHSPSFYRSMPDLSAFLVSPLPGHHPQNENSNNFVTPDVNKWDTYKRSISHSAATATSVDREKARKAARERARLKSDEELGLSPTDYANLKEKVRRKASVPTDDDVFLTSSSSATVKAGGSVPTTPVRETLRGGPRRLARPMSDVFDTGFSLRPNVDFPIAKTNPFLVQSQPQHQNGHRDYAASGVQQQQYPYSVGGPVIPTDNSGEGARGEVATEWYNYHEHPDPPRQESVNSSVVSAVPYEEEDGFLHLRLRLSGGKAPGAERKVSPEKAKSMGWASEEQYSPHSYLPPSHRGTPSSLQARADGNWFFDSKSAPGSTRPRSNTLSDLNFSPSSLNSPGMSSEQVPDISSTLAPAAPAQQTQTSPSTTAQPSTGGQKYKALSTDMLLDAGEGSPRLEEVKGASVPDISQHSTEQIPSLHPSGNGNDNGTSPNNNQPVLPPERKNRKSKDRDRRRSLIQAVSDFFTIRGSSSSSTTSGGAAGGASSNGASNNVSPSDKSSSQQSSSVGLSSSGGSNGYQQVGASAGDSEGVKERFSIFKLTPTKILQSAKDRRNSKSREVLVSPPPPAPSSPPRSQPPGMVPPPKPARSAQYLSQPEMVIQRLTQSPTTYKSHRTSRGEMGSTPALAAAQVMSSPVKPARSTMAVMSGAGGGNYFGGGGGYRNRMREMQEIQLQLESVDQQQRSLEARGVAVEKRIRGEVEGTLEGGGLDDQELMEEWFTLVREKTRLARWEKELLVRAEELELEGRKERLEEQLDNSLLLKDDIKSPEEKSREIELLHQLRAVEEQRGKLLSTFQEDLRQYENEDANLEAKIQNSRLSPKESNV